MLKYLKFTLGTVLFSVVIASLFAGGHWTWVGFSLVLAIWVVGDLLFDDIGFPEYHHPWILTVIVENTFFVMVFALFALVWITNPNDLLGVGHVIQTVVGYDVLAARETNTMVDYVGAGLGLGLVFAANGVMGGHELTHRTWDPVATFFGRWMYAMTGGFALETGHIVTHHPLVGCPEEDPATARRGDSIYRFLVHNTPAQISDAWRREKARLAAHGRSAFSPGNRVLRGMIRLAAIMGALFLISGWPALGIFAIAATVSKLFLEGLTYHGHFGQPRVSGNWPEPRHSWNSNAAVSSWVLFHIARHAAHHVDAGTPFYKLKPSDPDEVPVSYSYLFGSMMAYIPPLYRKLMLPHVLMWDRKFATPAEREIAHGENLKSGVPILLAAAAVAERGIEIAVQPAE